MSIQTVPRPATSYEEFAEFKDMNDWTALTAADTESIIMLASGGGLDMGMVPLFTELEPLTGELYVAVEPPSVPAVRLTAHVQLDLTLTGPELAEHITMTVHRAYCELHAEAAELRPCEEPPVGEPPIAVALVASRVMGDVTDPTISDALRVAAALDLPGLLYFPAPDTGVGDVLAVGCTLPTGRWLVTLREMCQLTYRCDEDAAPNELARDIAYTIAETYQSVTALARTNGLAA